MNIFTYFYSLQKNKAGFTPPFLLDICIGLYNPH